MAAQAFPRFIEPSVKQALSDTRVVMIAGPRQAGKTTLTRKLSGARRPFGVLNRL